MVQPATAVWVAGFTFAGSGGSAFAGKEDVVDVGRSARTLQICGVWAALLVASSVAIVVVFFAPTRADAVATLPTGFREEVAFQGLTNPTNVEFAQDGRVFVAEKSGQIKVFDGLSDTTPTSFADLRTNVHNFWDRGLLGLALAPNFPADPHVYVLYTYDAAIGDAAPRWGTPDITSDPCPNPPGATADGCVVSGRLSKLTASGNTMTGNEQVLIENWCQQYPSHSIGDLAFGSDGALYVTGGDGASFNFSDYGQDGNPLNPCGDPPGGVGATLTPPTAQGGALRSQDLRTSGDPVTLDGAILRVDPATGAAMAGNPLMGNADANARRIVAYGLRNPFRFTIRLGTSEVWVGDVGWNNWEEINRVVAPADSTVENFGWPCYEGGGRQAGYDGANLNICENLYAAGTSAVTPPYYAYDHASQTGCGTGSSSVAGLAFYGGGAYPDNYDGALFFTDYSRKCIWAMERGSNGLPDPARRSTFVTGATGPVDLEIGPGGDLFYADLDGGTIRRIKYFAANQPPVADAAANPTSGPAPLSVSFDGAGSSDPDGDALTYDWDFTSDGSVDATGVSASHTYQVAGTYTATLTVRDRDGAQSSDTVEISSGNTPPVATLGSPTASTTWRVNQAISFSGSATDQQDGALASSRLTWSLILHHCHSENDCHEHPVQDFPGVASGSFVAPDHEYPAYLELTLTATDSEGLTDTESVRLDPQTVALSFGTSPTGLNLVVGSTQATAPFSRTVIVGSANSISAPSPQTVGGTVYEFVSWSDGGAQTHNIVAGTQPGTYAATYRVSTGPACTITGTSANDTLSGTTGADVICGGGGGDTIRGLGGNDILKGEGGPDKLYGGAGNDTFDGGVGSDTANFSESPGAVSASLTDNTATGEGSDTLASIEKLIGSPANDTLTGSGGSDILNGGNGGDTLSGRDGADTLTGQGGDDTVHGDAGNDSVVGSAGADNLFGEEGDDTVNSRDGRSGNDSLDGGPHVSGDTATTDATERSIVGFP